MTGTIKPFGRVSVPLRGKGRDQRSDDLREHGRVSPVSVPLRGKGRDQRFLALAKGIRGRGFRPLAGKR